MAVDIHIKIDTIPGNSEIKGFEGQIQLESFSWNMSPRKTRCASTRNCAWISRPRR